MTTLLLPFLLVCADNDQPAPAGPRAALQAFNNLIGTWRGTGTPEGRRDQKQKGFWSETLRWEWKFKGSDAWLTLDVDNGKYFRSGELRYLPQTKQYRLTLQTNDKQWLAFEGPLQEHVLTVSRDDPDAKETQRLVVTLLHSNRFLYRYETKPADKPLFTRRYQVGATKEGEAFAAGQTGPECIVSGGLGTLAVTYKGKTYYVCCSGCRDAFKDDPEKFLKEADARKKEASDRKP